jgi:transcriptional regulator with XRE-family HTH domain
MDTLGQRLRRCRERMGWSQIDVAAKMGTSNMNISHYERDTRQPDIATLVRFAELYNVSVQWLMTGSDVSPQQTDIYDLLQRDNCTYRNVPLTEDDKQRIRDFMTGMLWDRLKRNQ